MEKNHDREKPRLGEKRRFPSEDTTVKKPKYSEEERRRESDEDDDTNSAYGSESPDEATHQTSKLLNDISARHRTVFLDNLPLQTRKRLLRIMFHQCGLIEEVRLIRVKKYFGKIVRKELEKKMIKVASITFANSSGLEKALAMNPVWINDNYVNVQHYDDTYVRGETFTSNRLFMVNAPHDVTKEQLHDFFLNECGVRPTYIRFLHKPVTEVFTGIIYIQFTSEEAVGCVLQKQRRYYGHRLNGKFITVTRELLDTDIMWEEAEEVKIMEPEIIETHSEFPSTHRRLRITKQTFTSTFQGLRSALKLQSTEKTTEEKTKEMTEEGTKETTEEGTKETTEGTKETTEEETKETTEEGIKEKMTEEWVKKEMFEK